MSNRFYTFVNQLVAGSVAKSSEVNAEFQGAEVGFTTVEAELNTAIKFPEDESDLDQRITEGPSARQGYFLGFDLTGALRVGNSFLIDWNMAGNKLRNLPSPVDTDEPVTLGYLNAFAGSLAGLPSIAAQSGPLTTDGATVAWGTDDQLVPSLSGVGAGSLLVLSGGAAVWLTAGYNAAFDPNGLLGSAYWNTSLTNFSDVGGQYWTNSTGTLSGATFDHKPQAAGYIPCGAGVEVTASVTVNTAGTSAGTIDFVLRYYDAGSILISESAATSVTMASADKQYVVSATTPGTTAYVVAVLKFDSVDASQYGVEVRNLKVERGSNSTPFNDFKTLQLAYGAVATTTFGAGFASPKVVIGDANATSGTLDLRSQAGAQAYDVRLQSTSGTNGTPGKGTLGVEAKKTTFTGVVGASAEYDAGNSGAAITIDFGANGQYQKVTLNSATPAITVATTGLAVGDYRLKVVQDGVGGRAPTWVGFNATDCDGNSFPTIASGIANVTFVYLYWDGTQFWVYGNAWD